MRSFFISWNTCDFFFLSQALKQMMQQLDHERNLKLDAFERVEDLQRQVYRVFFVFFIV